MNKIATVKYGQKAFITGFSMFEGFNTLVMSPTTEIVRIAAGKRLNPRMLRMIERKLFSPIKTIVIIAGNSTAKKTDEKIYNDLIIFQINPKKPPIGTSCLSRAE